MHTKINLLLIGSLLITNVIFAQDKRCIGKWKLYPKPQDGIISYLTIADLNNEYYLVRTKDPSQKWKMTWNAKGKAFDVNLDGKKGRISFEDSKKQLVFKADDGGHFEMVADK